MWQGALIKRNSWVIQWFRIFEDKQKAENKTLANDSVKQNFMSEDSLLAHKSVIFPHHKHLSSTCAFEGIKQI